MRRYCKGEMLLHAGCEQAQASLGEPHQLRRTNRAPSLAWPPAAADGDSAEAKAIAEVAKKIDEHKPLLPQVRVL